MSKPVRVISLDLETTGIDPQKHVPLSIGAVDPRSGSDFYVEFWWDEALITRKAMEVNRFDFVRPTAGVPRPDPARAVEAFRQWIWARASASEEIRILGLNPWFDHFMLKPTYEAHTGPKHFPFSHRFVDLSTLMYLLADLDGHAKDAYDYRKGLQEEADRELQKQKPRIFEMGAHHALYDAWWNVVAYQICKERLALVRAQGAA